MGYSSHLVLVVNKMDMCLDTNCWLLHVQTNDNNHHHNYGNHFCFHGKLI